MGDGSRTFISFKGKAHFGSNLQEERKRLLARLKTAEADLKKMRAEEPLQTKIAQACYDIDRLICIHGDVQHLLGSATPPRLAAWDIVVTPSGYPVLDGLAFGHPVLRGFARPIVTSLLLYIDPVQGYARTLSRWYKLLRTEADASDW